ncbi:hypothetical protein CEW81_10090 [Kluyvera genomosp. 3]|uniref:Uncharacterized protein n=1 Tax=Kluyvera genomosp. 3 TaxID=2774055 RepID=A0A248KIY7_9ENTR|nr:hypothetical protein CEW81_10090 [Kluyvera genomosp. 3]
MVRFSVFSLRQSANEADRRRRTTLDTMVEAFNTLLVYLLIAAINGWLLILWYQYNRRRTHSRRHARQASLQRTNLPAVLTLRRRLFRR